MKPIKPTAACPCSSGKTYRECCQPLHKGKREADTSLELMRSRYSAFACGEVDYLLRTLHPDHPDAKLDEVAHAANIRENCRLHKYPGLEILEHHDDGDRGFVKFRARVFARGQDIGFVEASTFARTGGAWRYLAGETDERPGGAARPG